MDFRIGAKSNELSLQPETLTLEPYGPEPRSGLSDFGCFFPPPFASASCTDTSTSIPPKAVTGYPRHAPQPSGVQRGRLPGLVLHGSQALRREAEKTPLPVHVGPNPQTLNPKPQLKQPKCPEQALEPAYQCRMESSRDHARVG